MFFKRFWPRQEKPIEIAKEPKRLTREDMEAIRPRLLDSSRAIYKAMTELNTGLRRPVTAVEIAGYLGVDSAKVTPRMPRMIKKGQVKVAYWAKHSDRRWRKYYIAIDKEK